VNLISNITRAEYKEMLDALLAAILPISVLGDQLRL